MLIKREAPSYSFFFLKTATSNSLFLKLYLVNFRLEPSLTATPSLEFSKFKFDISPFEFSPKLKPLSLIFTPLIKLPITFAYDHYVTENSLNSEISKIKASIPNFLELPNKFSRGVKKFNKIRSLF